MHEELVHIVITFAVEGAREHAGPIRQNRSLRPRGARFAGKRMLVVRVHEGAHSRRGIAPVKDFSEGTSGYRLQVTPGERQSEAIDTVTAVEAAAQRKPMRQREFGTHQPLIAARVQFTAQAEFVEVVVE